MRTHTLAILTALVLVPSAALADGEESNGRRRHAATDTDEQTTTEQKRDGDDAKKGDADGYVEPHYRPYHGGAIPAYAHIETKPNWGLIAAGITTFSGAYMGGLLYALATCSAQMDCRPGSNWLYLPLVGPFITAATAPTTGGAALAAFDGGIQVLGAVLTVTGIAAPRKFVMWQDKTAKLELAPMSPATARALPGGPQLPAMSGGVAITLTHL